MVKKGIDKHTDNLTERKEPLQAVLLADDAFTRNQFRPLNLDQPKVLCTLNNVPIIDYAIDFLASVGVEQVLVMCVADAVAEYVSHKSTSRLTLTVIQDPSFLNAGDALRELDKRSMVKSDPFLLMHADAVMNIDISAAMLAHKKRHEQDSAAIMTILMREKGVRDDDLVVGMDLMQRIYYYDQSLKSIRVPCSFISTLVELRSDLVDCGIDVCSPDLLARFSDNFDYGDIRREFVTNSVAEEEEGLQNIIYGHVVTEGYSSRVTNPYSYAQTSRDLLKRWCYPVVPETYFEKEFYQMQRHYLYVESNARIARSATVEGPGMIGTCTIGENAKLMRCTVGNYCVIAADAVLEETHLWSAVEIGPGVKVIQSIVADGAVIKAGAVVHQGCVIGAGCVVGENVVLPPYTRLSLKEEKEDDFGDDWDDDSSSNDIEEVEDGDQPCLDTHLVGPDGKGHIWKPKPDDEEYNEDDEGYLSVAEKLKSESIGYDRVALEALRSSFLQEPSDNFSDMGDDEGMPDYLDEYSGAVTFSTDAELFAANNNDEIIGRQKGVDVIRELKSICMEYEMISPIENLAIELNSFKFSQNASYSDCVTAATIAILERMNITHDMKDVKMATEFKKALQHWAPLLQKMSITMEEEKAIVLALERCACEETEMGTVLSSGMSFRFLLTVLEDEEVVSDEAIFAWADERQTEGDTPRGRLFRSKAVQEFLEWLREEESDDDDNEDSEEDSD